MAGFVISGVVVGIGVFGGTKAVEAKYPAQTQTVRPAEKKVINGKEKVFIGYTGISEENAKKIKKEGSNRSLFTTKSKAEAQGYALTGTKKDPVVMEVWADRFPKDNELEPQWFEGPHSPISKKGLKDMGATVGEIEPVNTDTRLGFSGAFQRMMRDNNNSQ